MKGKTAVKIAGALFLLAMVSSLAGGGIIESLIGSTNYLSDLLAEKSRLSVGIILELINGLSVIGIAVILSPVIKKYNERLGVGYVCFRIMEAMSCVIAAVIPYLLVVLSREYIKAGSSDVSYYQAVGTLIESARAGSLGILLPLFFCLGALILYYSMYVYRLVPRFIAAWGFVGAVLVLPTIFELSTGLNMVLAFPIILNEIFLGFWLIVKGLQMPVTSSGIK